MSKYKLIFKLKQHTPIIHFQYDQSGATLRASELKPKLDKFLIEKLKQENIDYSNWLIPGQEVALDYKVRLEAKDIKSIKILKGRNYKIPNFFANMGDDYIPLALSISNNPIELTITSFHSALRTQIERNITYFFLITNFGTRQSKGFGSFTIANDESINNSYFDAYFNINSFNCNDFILQNNNALYTNDWKNYLKLFWYIETFYKSLRSGINRKGRNNVTKFYIKPAIFYYAMNVLQRQWDKKSIKEYYVSIELSNQQRGNGNPDILTYSDNNNPHILIKDIFGLSSLENWRTPYRSTVTKNHNSIDRFKSPLLFKPIKTNSGFFVGLKCFEVDNNFLDETFNINFGRNTGLQLETPSVFDWNLFWNYYFTNLPSLDERSSPVEGKREQEEYCILNSIKLKRN